MHEVAIAEEIKEIVISELKKNNAKKVNKINLQIGKLTSIVPEALQFAFEAISKNTELENAKIEIEMMEIKAKCQKCKKEFIISEFDYECPYCKNMNLKIIQGRETIIKSLEIE